MLIDWFTVAAQAVNFLVLVWLLKRFLYKPILDAIDTREKRIAAELADADSKRAEAKLQRDDFEKKNQTFDKERQDMLTKATSEANAERQRLMDDARKTADVLRVKREDSLQREYVALTAEVTRRTQAEVFAIARKALTELASTSLEIEMTGVFIKRLQELDDAAKTDFAGTTETQRSSMIVRSAFDLPPAQQAVIQDAVSNTFSMAASLTFETVPDVISGIELTSGGRRISWSIADYLVSMEQRIGELLRGETQPEPEAELQPETKSA